MTDYMDFELLIESERGDGYWAKVLRAPDGGGAESLFTLPSEEVMWQALSGARSPSRHLEIAGSKALDFKQVGMELFRSVFSGPVESRWRGSLAKARAEGRKLRLRLHLGSDPNLLRVPWELLYDASGFIAFETPIVRTLDIPVAPRELLVREPLRILVVLSCPPDVPPLQIEDEWATLDGTLGGGIELVKLIQPTLEQIEEHLGQTQWHILHFVGHGFAGDEGGSLILGDPDGGGLPVGFEQLQVFLSHESLRLVVLNACEGALTGRDDAFSGVAQALVRRGIPAVIAMQRTISDTAAIAFAKHFYMSLAKSLPIDEGMVVARRALNAGKHRGEWPIPVLYLSTPDGQIVEPPQAGVGEGKGGWSIPIPIPNLIISIAAGVLLLGVAIWLLAREPTVDPPDRPRKLPRPASENHPDCPSPPDVDIAFERIGPGTFKIGDKGHQTDRPIHQATITKPFCLGTYEITRQQWSQVRGEPLPPEDDWYLPAQGITYGEAQQFIARLNEGGPTGPYRLPTEAEWEYAARGGERTLYSFGDDEAALPLHGNCRGGRDGFADLTWVGQLEKNPLGLYDMYGNLYEWVLDWYEPYSDKPRSDPFGPVKGEKRIRRGGSWNSRAHACSSGHRSIVQQARGDQETGFRIVREIR